jgi:hypothetical protein
MTFMLRWFRSRIVFGFHIAVINGVVLFKKEQSGLMAFEKRMLRRMSGPKCNALTRGMRAIYV